jgi:hypothetical protein
MTERSEREKLSALESLSRLSVNPRPPQSLNDWSCNTATGPFKKARWHKTIPSVVLDVRYQIRNPHSSSLIGITESPNDSSVSLGPDPEQAPQLPRADVGDLSMIPQFTASTALLHWAGRPMNCTARQGTQGFLHREPGSSFNLFGKMPAIAKLKTIRRTAPA